MLRPHKLRMATGDEKLDGLKGFLKACAPRALGARWLLPSAGARILLTFDDGPNAAFTPKALDALDALGAKAIFFVIGENARAEPELLREIVARGHVVGNHSDTHPWLTEIDEDAVMGELSRCQDAVAAALGAPPVYFRPPYGAQSAMVRRVARRLGLETILWASEAGEYARREAMSGSEIAAALGASLSADQIVLLHDDTQLVWDILTDPAFTSAAAAFEMSFDIARSLSGAPAAQTAAAGS